MKKIYLLPLMVLFQITFAMEQSSTTSLAISRQKISTIIQDNPTLTAEKIATFLQVKKILSIAKDISNDLHEKHGSVLQYRSSTCSELDSSANYRTQEGFILFCGLYPRFLATPWGLIRMYNGACFYDGTEHLPTPALFQRLGVKFIQCTQAQQSDNKDVYEVLPPTFDDKKGRFKALKMPLTPEDLWAEIGSSKIILAESDKRDSVYEITAIDGEPCPKATNLNSSERRKPDLEVREEWKTLEGLSL